MFKKIIMSVMLLAALLLAACSESQSDKEVVKDGYQSLMEADSFDATFDLDVNVDADVQDPFIEPYIQMINDMELSMDMVADNEKQIQETVVHFEGTLSPMTISMDLPMYQNLKEEKMYIQTDSLVENLGMFMPLPEDAKGKLIEVDMADVEGMEEEEMDIDELTEQVQSIVNDFIDEKSEDDFTEEDGTYIVTFTKDDLANLVGKIASEVDDTITDEELQEGIDEINTALEDIDLNKFEIHMTMDGDQVKSQKFVLDVGFEAEGNAVQLELTADTVYNSINEDVEFTINPEDSEIMPMEEFEQLMMGGMEY
ncbi:hypothetical protein [Piscibacillus halophilus]|uniref:hypothetical protein n=1 Tax=Piscibacillus halophilus TaxID=571933 RepID=UPI00158E1DB0|nr:hypothetical protein [Piscibacillus halophilus]